MSEASDNRWQPATAAGGPTWSLASASAADMSAARVEDFGTKRYEATLTSPPFSVPANGLSLEFQQRRAYSWANTVGVLEIAVDVGPFIDIIDAGGSFLAGAYDGRSLLGNPLGFRNAWAAQPDTDLTTRVKLPDSAKGKHARLRFRIGSAGTGDVLPGWSLGALRCQAGS